MRGINRSLPDDLFAAAFYLRELVDEGLIEVLFIAALDDAAKQDDIWWQVRALQELGWDEDLKQLLVERREERGSPK